MQYLTFWQHIPCLLQEHSFDLVEMKLSLYNLIPTVYIDWNTYILVSLHTMFIYLAQMFFLIRKRSNFPQSLFFKFFKLSIPPFHVISFVPVTKSSR